MKKTIKERLITVLRSVPVLLCITFAVFYFFSDTDITAETIINYAPENILAAAVFLLFVYAVKSVSVIFPVIVLNIAGGFLFETPLALLVNASGVLITLIIPYFIGRASGTEFADKLCKKHPKLGDIMNRQQSNGFFISFFLRIISCLPGDIVSMYLGACKIPFAKYLVGGFIGTIPGTISATLIGIGITDPSSPLFWIAVGTTAGLSIISFSVYFLWQKHKKKKTV